MTVIDAFSSEVKHQGLEVSWNKSKIQDFGDLLGEPVESWLGCYMVTGRITKSHRLYIPS